MAKKLVKKDQTSEVLENVEQSLTKVELFFENNKKQLLIVAGVIVGLALVYFAYQNFYAQPRELEAQKEIFMAEKYLAQDSLQLALNGNGQNLGFLEVADEFGGTKAGELANYYAGVCYLNLGDFKNAIEYLDKFSSNDEVLSVVAKGAIGDAFLELNQPKEALEYYEKAAKTNDNAAVIPIYLQKAAMTAEILNDYKKALSFYQRIQKEFPESREAAEVEKNIAYTEAKINSEK